MSKGSKRRPGEGYAENYDKIFGKVQLTEEQEIVRRVGDAMLQGVNGMLLPVRPLAAAYTDFIEWQRERIESTLAIPEVLK